VTLIGPIHNTITNLHTCSCGLSKGTYKAQPRSQGLSSSGALERQSGALGGGKKRDPGNEGSIRNEVGIRFCSH